MTTVRGVVREAEGVRIIFRPAHGGTGRGGEIFTAAERSTKTGDGGRFSIDVPPSLAVGPYTVWIGRLRYRGIEVPDGGSCQLSTLIEALDGE